MDMVASELVGPKSTWLKCNYLKDSVITLKYSGLHKIAMNNWNPTKHYSTLSKDVTSLIYDIG